MATNTEVYILILIAEMNIIIMEVHFPYVFFRRFEMTVNDAVVKRVVDTASKEVKAELYETYGIKGE